MVGNDAAMAARACEALGFDGAVLSDHLFFPREPTSKYPYSPDGRHTYDVLPWPDPFVTIAALGAITTRLRFVTAVYLLALRHPVVAAKSIATAANFAPGRVAVGVGVGWQADEYDGLGVSFADRGRITEDSIGVMRALLSPNGGTYVSPGSGLPELAFEPRPPTAVPILVGGVADRAVRRAIEIGDGYIGVGHGIDRLLETVPVLRERATAAGRGPAFELHFTTPEIPTATELERLADAGLSVLHLLPWRNPFEGPCPLEEKLAGLERAAATMALRS
jgi:probable F420-dependent oxidoreductase